MKHTAAVVAIVLALTVGSPLRASVCAQQLPYCTSGVGQINLNPADNAANFLVNNAINYWSSSCGQYGSEMPAMAVGSGDITFDVYYVNGRSTLSSSPEACGVTNLYVVNGSVTGGRVIVWSQDANGDQCQDPALILDHELGHVYGLADVYDSACSGNVMYAAVQNAFLASDTCDVLQRVWDTPWEAQRDTACTTTCRGACYEGLCSTDECFQYPDGSYSESCYSPIIIDVAGDGFHLTSAANGVRFDLNSDGTPESLSWTKDGGDAFLCLDRNRNGRIDKGSELFGNYTVLTNGMLAHNGFAALAEYDGAALGGNENGWIDAADAVWPLLMVWHDDNHDGESQEGELDTLAAAGISKISVEYTSAARVDDFGNAFRYKGKCVLTKNGKEHTRDIYDVFFVPLR